MGIWMKSADPQTRGITVSGGFRYDAKEGGIVDVHPAHVADFRGAGFRVMTDEDMRHPPVEKPAGIDVSDKPTLKSGEEPGLNDKPQDKPVDLHDKPEGKGDKYDGPRPSDRPLKK